MPSKLARFLKRHSDASAQVAQEVDTTRKRLSELTEEANAVRAAPVPLEAAQARVDRAVASAQAETLPGGLGAFTRPEGNAVLDNEDTKLAFARSPLSFIAAVAPDAVRLELHAKLAATYARMNATPFSDADRKRRLVEVEREVAQLERDEEAAIRAAESAGMAIERRADAAPSVVLLPDRELGVDLVASQ